MDVPLLQGTKPVTTTSAWMRAGCGGGAPDATTALATATTPITSRRFQAMDAMLLEQRMLGVHCRNERT